MIKIQIAIRNFMKDSVTFHTTAMKTGHNQPHCNKHYWTQCKVIKQLVECLCTFLWYIEEPPSIQKRRYFETFILWLIDNLYSILINGRLRRPRPHFQYNSELYFFDDFETMHPSLPPDLRLHSYSISIRWLIWQQNLFMHQTPLMRPIKPHESDTPLKFQPCS